GYWWYAGAGVRIRATPGATAVTGNPSQQHYQAYRACVGRCLRTARAWRGGSGPAPRASPVPCRGQAALATIDRHITGVTVTARRHGTEVPKQATKAAREALKPMKLDPVLTARSRGKAITATPAHLKAMNTAPATRPQPKVGRRRGTQELPELTRLRDRALATLAFGIAGRSEEVSSLDIEGITQVAEGLEVHVPSVKGRPPRDVAVAYGENPDTCPVRCWRAWREAADLTAGPAFLPVDQKGRLGTQRLGPDGCRLAITRAAQRASLDVKLTGHSARRSLVSTGRKRGKRAEKLRKQGGWAADSPRLLGVRRRGQTLGGHRDRGHRPVKAGGEDDRFRPLI
ncbi:hypothetical protein, partial [Streptomyces sp. NPDC056796]|uniref:hypothetical protein n=1 Tax=Streptomyces sp. NPDC056796 TaxID=3345947 RepID=UPI0036822117